MDIMLDSRDVRIDKAGMTPQTCRAGRSLLGLSQAELGELAGVTPLTVRNYEGEKSEPSYKTWRAMKSVLERRGVEFIDEGDGKGPGVRLRKAK
jgi:DNA-binding XRE family transcriptional regulator